jgi:hypothetical protein
MRLASVFLVFGRTFLLVASLGGGGCSSGSAPFVDGGGPPRILEPFTDVMPGLKYGETQLLKVAYRLDDATRTPIPGARVRFAIFSDPGGSTLSSDRADTDGNGIATVSLTAGTQERSFNVVASADNARDVHFSVGVSKMAFVTIDVQLGYTATPVTTLKALLYLDQTCAHLPPEADPPSAFTTLETAGPSGTLSFTSLRSVSYAIAARAEDSAAHLVAAGCVDVGPPTIPPGSHVMLTVPLQPVQATALGTFDLSTTLTRKANQLLMVIQPWANLAACPTGAAAGLLDRLEPHLSPSLRAALDAKRAPADTQGCRPAMQGAAQTLDGALQALLQVAGSPAASLAVMTNELATLAGSVALTSRLEVSAASLHTLGATHTLGAVTLALSATDRVTYDVGAAGVPVVEAKNIPVSFDGSTLTLGEHGFTLGLGALLRRGFAKLSFAKHLPAVTPATPPAFAAALVAAAKRSGKTDCLAIEDLVCTTTGAAGCTGAIAPACTTAATELGAALDAPFSDPAGLDLVWSGSGHAFDSDGDLLVDTIKPASWTTTFADPAPFSGLRAP